MNTGPSLQIRAWLALATVRALSGMGVATLAPQRSSVTLDKSVCRTPVLFSEVIITRQYQDTRTEARSKMAYLHYRSRFRKATYVASRVAARESTTFWST